MGNYWTACSEGLVLNQVERGHLKSGVRFMNPRSKIGNDDGTLIFPQSNTSLKEESNT